MREPSFKMLNLFCIIELAQNDELGFSVGLTNDNNMFKWDIIFNGPDGTIYEVSSPTKHADHSLIGRLLQSRDDVP